MEKKIIEALKELGVPMAIKGFKYLVMAITKTIENNGEVAAITKELYPDITKEFKTTPQRVERSIRHAIYLVFTHCDTETIYKYFGNYIGDKVTNKNFIATLTNEIMMNQK